MAIKERAQQFRELYRRFLGLGVEGFLETTPPYTPFENGPSISELRAQVAFLRATFDPIIDSEALDSLGFHGLQSLQSTLQNVYNMFDQLQKTRDQGSFQNFAGNFDALCNQVRSLGVPLLTLGQAQVEAARSQLTDALERAEKNNQVVEELSRSVRNLIAPAVAGSLSAEFSKRRNSLVWGRYAWLVAVAAIGVFATYTTFGVVHDITAALRPPTPQATGAELSLWSAAVLRTLVLVPILAGFGFAFAQYRKERDFEEEYAHKAAVAHSLPNYGDLTREGPARDQIVSAATAVIFMSPTEQARRLDKGSAILGEMREVLDALTKAVARK